MPVSTGIGISVYPRWRGEHSLKNSLVLSLRGLSPLARGTLAGDKYLFERFRFIPAGAGNTERGGK
ncbi:hypothetical protein J415_08595 [Klebsiella michiganensis HKOPL1]|nr:hypothetical protein J415_08595 [Klebsiella michiganensis HKOPL1]